MRLQRLLRSLLVQRHLHVLSVVLLFSCEPDPRADLVGSWQRTDLSTLRMEGFIRFTFEADGGFGYLGQSQARFDGGERGSGCTTHNDGGGSWEYFDGPSGTSEFKLNAQVKSEKSGCDSPADDLVSSVSLTDCFRYRIEGDQLGATVLRPDGGLLGQTFLYTRWP